MKKRNKRRAGAKWAMLYVYCMFAVGGLTAAWALPCAWMERGYRGGVGGEWVLVFFAAYLGFELAEKIRYSKETRR